MNFTADLHKRIENACGWLSKMHVNGGYRRWERPSPDKPGELPNEVGPVSVVVTGYALHLYSWLYKTKESNQWKSAAGRAANWLLENWTAHRTLVDPGQCNQYFFDMGIAGRALFASNKAFLQSDYWDAAICIASRMKEFAVPQSPGAYYAVLDESGHPLNAEDEANTTWSKQPGPYQLKAAMIWKSVQRVADFDDMALHWFTIQPPKEYQPLPERKRLSKPDMQLLVAEQRRAVDELHPLASSIEALHMGESSCGRAQRNMQFLNDRIARCEWMRTDVLAQQIRLNLLMGGQLRVGDLHRLMETQHECGGFSFSTGRVESSLDLSVPATIFAVQTLAMAADQVNVRFGRRDLSIV